MTDEIIIVGAFHEIIELVEELNISIVGLIDNQKLGHYKGYQILASDSNADLLLDEFHNIPFIITPDVPNVRKRISEMYLNYGFSFRNIISSYSRISKSAVLGNGLIIQSGANVSSEAKIEDFVKLNTNANVMHDSVIGKYCTVAPNALILGNVKIGQSCYIGANSTILPNISICDNVIIGAGAVVTKDILVPGTFVGVPAKNMEIK